MNIPPDKFLLLLFFFILAVDAAVLSIFFGYAYGDMRSAKKSLVVALVGLIGLVSVYFW